MRYLVTPDGKQALFNRRGKLIPLSVLRQFPNPEMVIDTIPDFDLDLGEHPLSFWQHQDETTFEIRMAKGNWRHRSWKKYRQTQYHTVDGGGSKWDRAV